MMIQKRYASLVLALLIPVAQADLAVNVFTKYQAEVDQCVERALEFVAGLQAEDGSFIGEKGETTGVISLCGMAFLSVGHTPGYGPYGEHINRCVDYIVSHQDGQGVLFAGHSGHGPMYSHNISTLFLSEVSGMVNPKRQKRVEKTLGRALQVLLRAQQVSKQEMHRGGWRYKPDSNDSDLSCSGWALMALKSAKLNGATVPDSAIEEAVKYIYRNHDPRRGTFGYQNHDAHAKTLTGAAVLCLELCGEHGKPSTIKAGDYILNNYQSLHHESHGNYGNYYNAQGMFQLGGKYWEKYAEYLYKQYPKSQNEDGSFPGHRDGTIYNTAITVLALTVPYRQLPIYQRDETVDEE